jgi:hypothetical protein
MGLLEIFSLPCVKGGAEERGGGIVIYKIFALQSLSQLRCQLPLHKGAKPYEIFKYSSGFQRKPNNQHQPKRNFPFRLCFRFY